MVEKKGRPNCRFWSNKNKIYKNCFFGTEKTRTSSSTSTSTLTSTSTSTRSSTSTSTSSSTSTSTSTSTSSPTLLGSNQNAYAYWSFNGVYTESFNGYTLSSTSGSVGFGMDRFNRDNKALLFSNGYIIISNCPSASSVLSAALWVNPTIVPSGYMCMFWWKSYDSGESFFISSSFQVFFYVNTISTYGPSNLITMNTWSHVGYTLNCITAGCTASHYINGVLTATSTLGTALLDQSGTCYIGGASNGWSFTGYIDDLLNWNYQLTAAQMMNAKNFSY